MQPIKLTLRADQGTPTPVTTAPTPDADLTRWHELVSQIGQELAAPLTAALERVTTLSTTGRIDKAGLRALLDEVDRARQTGIWCQQIARLASGRVKPSTERVHLTHTVQSVLAYRTRQLQSKGITFTQSLAPVEIQADASMLFGLLNNLVDWWLDCTQGQVEVHVDRTPWPERGRLICKILHRPVDLTDQVQLETPTAPLNTMSWHVLEATAKAMGLIFDRQVNATHARVCLEFPNTVALNTFVDTTDQRNETGFSDSVNSKPLAGSHVLVVASRRDLRIQIREALKPMGLVLDFASTVKDAAEFCVDRLPHAIVFENQLRSNAFERLVANIRREVPEFVFIELLDGGNQFDISSVSQSGMARIGRDAVLSALPSALVYELTRVM